MILVLYYFLTSIISINCIDLLTKVSYNLPNLSACAEWNLNGTRFINDPMRTFQPHTLFLDRNNTLYVTNPATYGIYKSLNGSNNFNIKIIDSRGTPQGLFISTTGDIFTSDEEFGLVDRWIAKSKIVELAARFCRRCESIFISIHDVIYCSITEDHQIVTKALYNYSDLMTIVAGVGFEGFAENMLKFPERIFVNINLDLYVADSGNHRVQLFHSGEANAITIAGSLNTTKLNRPTSVVLDVNNYVYIVDHENHRIVASTPYGFRCIVSCNGSGSSSDRLKSPQSMAFDNFGNIYVTDPWNNRIQKFSVLNNTCRNLDSKDYTKMNTTLTSTPDFNTSIAYESEYKSIVTRDSLTFWKDSYCDEPQYFYENLQIHVFKQGNYDIFINSTAQLYVMLYKDYFYPENINTNLLFRLDEWCKVNQIKFTSNFHSNKTYNLIISTAFPNVTFSFSFVLIGPSHISLNQTNQSSIVKSMYMSALTSNSHKCNHERFEFFNYYCEVIQIHIIETGTYTIISNSMMDMYAYTYKNNFTLLDLSINKIPYQYMINDNCNKQFRISFNFQINTSIILVVTTTKQQQRGNFSITVMGPNSVFMKHQRMYTVIRKTIYFSFVCICR